MRGGELLKMGVLDIDDIVMPDILSWKAHVDNIKIAGHLFLEGRHRRKDGTTYPAEVNVTYISLEKSDYMVAVARDITEQRKQRRRCRRAKRNTKTSLTLPSMGSIKWILTVSSF